MFKTVANRIVSFFIDTALLYFLSCCLALLGVYSMMRSPLLAGDLLKGYFEAYGIFLVYVVVLTGFGLLVLRRLALPVDGLVMAGLALLLVLDPAFFNDVFYTANPMAGMPAGTLSLFLGMGLYALLIRFGGVPWTKSVAAMIVLTAIFVSYYPVGLSMLLREGAKAWYFYWLWWMPLALAMVCRRSPNGPEISGGVAMPEHMRKWFVRSCAIIVFYIVYSHLAEARYAWGLPFHAMYLAPGCLAIGLLILRFARTLDSEKQRLIWVWGLAAAVCAAMKSDHLLVRLPPGLSVSPFRCGLIAVALFFVYGWKKSRGEEPTKSETRLWAFAASSVMLLVVSGNSMAEGLAAIGSFNFTPWFYIALMLGIFSRFNKTSIIATLAGWSFLIAIVPHLPLSKETMLGVSFQAWPIWFALVQWRYHGRSRQWAFSLAGAFAYLMAADMCVATRQPAWVADYLVLSICMFLIGREMKNVFLWILSIVGMLAVPVYLSRSFIGTMIDEVRKAFGPGTMMTILAFLMLPLAYFMSVLKKRRQA